MKTIDLIMVADVFFVFAIFTSMFIWRYRTRPINILFRGEKFHIDHKDKDCIVITFDDLGTFRKKGNNYIEENGFNLAEWTFAERGHKHWLEN